MIAEPGESLKTILNNAPIGIARIRNRTIEWANEALCQATGYSCEELKGKNTRFLYQDDDEYQRVGEALYTGGRAETTMQTKDGRAIHVSLWASPPIDDDSHVVVVHNLARQRQAENALRLTQFSVDNALDPIVWLGRRGEIIYVNDAACKAVGYTRDEILSMRVFDLTPGHDAGEVGGTLGGAKRAGRTTIPRFVQRRRMGRSYPAEASSKYLQYNGNEYVWVTFRDITKRKRAEEALEEKAAFLEALVNTSPDGFFVVDDTGRTVLENERFIEQWKIPREIAEGEAEPMIQHVAVMAKYSDELHEHVVLLRSHPDMSIRDEVELKDGSVLDRYSSPVAGRDGKYYGRIWAFHDITALKQTQHALEESEEQYRHLFDNSPGPIVEIDGSTVMAYIDDLRASGVTDLKKHVDDHPNIIRECHSLMKFITVNKAALELYEVPDLERFSESARHFVANAPIELLRDEALCLVEGTEHAEGEQVHLRTNGTKICVHSNWTVDRGKGKTRILISETDITRRKQAEEALQKSERELQIKSDSLEEANTALKVLLRQRDEDRKALENTILSNVRELVSPYVDKLRAGHLSYAQEAYLSMVESGLNDIVSPFLQKMASAYSHFTPTEVQIANLIKSGKTSKEIAKLMNVSTGTVEAHRNNIRKKLGLNNKSINLQTYLLSM